MKTLIIAVALVTTVFASACSSNTTDPTPSTGTGTGTGTPTTDPTTSPPADTTTPPDTTPAAPTVKAPKIDEIMKMAGALHVSWTNAEPSCDSIELERKTATVAYKVVATLPGEADNKHDTTGNERDDVHVPRALQEGVGLLGVLERDERQPEVKVS